MFYKIVRVILENDRSLHLRMGMDRASLEQKVTEETLTFEECCRLVSVARECSLLRYMMESCGMGGDRRQGERRRIDYRSLH